ncbi:MAG: TRAP transporter large permease subunit [Pseudomonadales bacterium]|jgi:tripartite ATP-independent transporter DctM subunit|nr:TRAP transporter large permease subunit [Gammaproteobacteria bacterium]MDA7771277.1 TRAP transporter large permease subunit [Pseudomonadales bacterium]MBT3734171.1 TRAP transporter large permease subunit [Gammaproteobacteria bacterium]MDA8880404.1 TRAP transporter large permease subunit [Pseudomonadales bacterium]MDC0994727.1 TRAP transporter large permease subunit [Pseudomonadales bacterium]|tara:strand:- start:1262 stop:2611 length:1350 start_codon:yes stop_codon:yes gene_type:complete
MSVGDYLSIAMFIAFILLIFTGFPVAWVLGGLAVLFTAIGIILKIDFGLPVAIDWDYSSLVVDRIWDVMNNWVLVALPMFIFMGLMLDRSGVARRLMTNFSRLFGGVRGGMALSVAFIGILLAASTGIIGASVVLLALLGLPQMEKLNYQPELAVGTVCAVGTLGILIPPSIMLVLMADRLAMPVGDLFLGALFPGLLLGALFVAYIIIYAWFRPEVAPVPADREKINLAILIDVFFAVLPPAGLIITVLGSIFFGIATPTEAAGVGAFGATALAWFNNQLNLGVFRHVIQETTKTTAYIFAIFLGATAYSLVLRGLGGDELIEGLLKGLPFEPVGVIIAILFFTFILGFFLDWIEITLIVLPLVSPVVVDLDFDLVWFTVLFAVCLQTSFLTPPVGFSIFYVKGVAPKSMPVSTIYRGVIPFIILQVIGLCMIFYWQGIVTWLPSLSV